MTPDPQRRFRVMLAFALVYFFWGSTYLAIGIAVQNIPAELMAGSRFLVAGALMLVWCALRGRRILFPARELGRLLVIGVLLLSVANVILAWAEEIVPTGLAALIVSVTPLWFLLIETWILRGDHISRRGMAGLALGVGGIVVLLWPKLVSTNPLSHRELFACLALLGGSLAWAIGSVLSKRWQTSADPFTASGWEMLFAGLVNLAMAALLGDFRTAVWTTHSIAAIAYLVVFGSWVGFSAYVWLLHNVPMPKVATYAYVNPVVAVILGWLAWNGWLFVRPAVPEEINAYIVAGTIIVVVGVALVTSAKVRTRTGAPAPEPELPAVESTGD